LFEKLEINRIIGNKIHEIIPSSTLEKNKYNHSIKTEYLSSGIYFIKVKINNSESTIKLIVSN
ncbi:MAG: T9SS type A sorting domain-containing protein, partial [Dolichospermum sp.]